MEGTTKSKPLRWKTPWRFQRNGRWPAWLEQSEPVLGDRGVPGQVGALRRVKSDPAGPGQSQ